MQALFVWGERSVPRHSVKQLRSVKLIFTLRNCFIGDSPYFLPSIKRMPTSLRSGAYLRSELSVAIPPL